MVDDEADVTLLVAVLVVMVVSVETIDELVPTVVLDG